MAAIDAIVVEDRHVIALLRVVTVFYKFQKRPGDHTEPFSSPVADRIHARRIQLTAARMYVTIR